MPPFVYKLLSETSYRPTIFNKQIPSRCAISACRKILQTVDNKEAVEIKLEVKNVLTNKVYYYRACCLYDPVYKQVSENKFIACKYRLSLMKIPKELI